MQISVSVVDALTWIRITHLPSKNLENYATGAADHVTIIRLCAVRYLIFVEHWNNEFQYAINEC